MTCPRVSNIAPFGCPSKRPDAVSRPATCRVRLRRSVAVEMFGSTRAGPGNAVWALGGQSEAPDLGWRGVESLLTYSGHA